MVPRIFLTILLYAKGYEVFAQRCEYLTQPTLTTTSYIHPAPSYVFPTAAHPPVEHCGRNDCGGYTVLAPHPSPPPHPHERRNSDDDFRNLLYYFLVYALTKNCGCDNHCNTHRDERGPSHFGGCDFPVWDFGCGCDWGKERGCGDKWRCCETNCDKGIEICWGGKHGKDDKKEKCYTFGKNDCCHWKEEPEKMCGNMAQGIIYIPYPVPVPMNMHSMGCDFPCGWFDHKMHEDYCDCNDVNEINLIIKTDC